jgi:hypothetical protein
MHKYAAAAALTIALNITMLTPAFSAMQMEPQHEEGCDGWAHGLRAYAIGCHWRFECRRQYSDTAILLVC